MPYRHRRNYAYRSQRPESLGDLAVNILGGLAILLFVSVWLLDGFLPAVKGVLAFLAIPIGIVFVLRFLSRRRKRHQLELLRTQLQDHGLEQDLTNFINRFGLTKESGFQAFSYRNYSFEQHRLDDLLEHFRAHGVTTDHKTLFRLLRVLIDEKERNLTFESIRQEPKLFSAITPTDFEHLIARLFESMSYSVQLTGKTGDQGADLIASKDGRRTLVQAKRYNNWSTGNDAVQQAVGALKLYDCSEAIVVTTSEFTQEAIALAKANHVRLIAKHELQELLLTHLKESWA